MGHGVDFTDMLTSATRGNAPRSAELLPSIYDALRRIAGQQMRHERPDHTLTPTALVNEAYLRLVDVKRVDYESRAHFFALASRIMRRILVDHARKKNSQKRGGGLTKITLETDVATCRPWTLDVLALEQALERLAALHPRQARIAELRLFAGLETRDIRTELGIAERTARDDWAVARAWLLQQLSGEHTEP